MRWHGACKIRVSRKPDGTFYPMQTLPATSATAASKSSSPEQIRKVAREFESIFTGIMLKEMRKTVGDNPLMPASFGEGIYTGMLDDKYSQMLSSNDSLGLAGMIERELTKDQAAGRALPTLQSPTLPGLPQSFSGAFTAPQSGVYGSASNTATGAAAAPVRKWKKYIDQASSDHGVDSSLIAAVIAQESGGNPKAVSPKGAKGLMQLMDSTAGAMGVQSSFSPEDNVQGGTRYLRSLLDKFGGNEQLALASYNAGPSAVERYGTVPPYAETRQYVDSVLRLKKQFATMAVREGQ